MYTINIKHRGDKNHTTYKIYREDEATEQELEYKYWKDADTGDYAISDDKYLGAHILIKRMVKPYI